MFVRKKVQETFVRKKVQETYVRKKVQETYVRKKVQETLTYQQTLKVQGVMNKFIDNLKLMLTNIYIIFNGIMYRVMKQE